MTDYFTQQKHFLTYIPSDITLFVMLC